MKSINWKKIRHILLLIIIMIAFIMMLCSCSNKLHPARAYNVRKLCHTYNDAGNMQPLIPYYEKCRPYSPPVKK
jgi:hypothetical protein